MRNPAVVYYWFFPLVTLPPSYPPVKNIAFAKQITVPPPPVFNYYIHILIFVIELEFDITLQLRYSNFPN